MDNDVNTRPSDTDMPEDTVAAENADAASVTDDYEGADAASVLDPRETALAEAEARALDYEDRWLRLAADFENTRRRAARERELATEQGAERSLHTVIRVIDDLERAADAAQADNATVAALRDGLALVLEQVRTALRESGIDIVDPEGTPFDPALHEAVMRDPHGDANIVTRVLARGYTRGGRVVRPAQVVVGG